MKVMTLINGELRQKDIENTLEALQSIVGGWIEIPYLSSKLSKEGIDVVINEEGKLIGLEPQIVVLKKGINRPLEVVVGNCVFVSHNEEGETIGLTDKQIRIVENELKAQLIMGDKLIRALFI